MFPISFSFGRHLSQNVDEQDRNIARTRIAELPRLFPGGYSKMSYFKKYIFALCEVQRPN